MKLTINTLKEMKKVYDFISDERDFKERSVAEICYVFNYDYRKKKQSILNCIDNLCEIGFQITERDGENNEYFGVLPSEKNRVLYNKYFSNLNCQWR